MFPTAFKNWADHLVPGESRLAVILAHDRRQARVIFKYASVLLQTPLLCGLVEQERDEAIDLTKLTVCRLRSWQQAFALSEVIRSLLHFATNRILASRG